jgi:hypothetical protein
MTLALLSLLLVGPLTPASLSPSRRGPQGTGPFHVSGSPCLLADLTPDDPPLPDPTRRTRQRPRAYLDNECSSNDPQSEEATGPGARGLADPAGPSSRRWDEAALCLPFHFPRIYALCTLLI